MEKKEERWEGLEDSFNASMKDKDKTIPMCEMSRDVSMGQGEANTHEFGASLDVEK